MTEKKFKQPKMTITELNIIYEKCRGLGIDPEQYRDVQYAGKLIFDLTRLELSLRKDLPVPDPADYKEGGKYDYNNY